MATTAGDERAEDGDDLDDAGEHADEQPVRQPDRPEGGREHRPDDDDEHALTPHERTELEVDQLPRVTHGLTLAAWHDRAGDVDRAFALEDPVRRGREDEERADEDLERHPAVLDGGIEELRARGQVVQPAIERHEEVVLDARRALSFLSEPVLGPERAASPGRSRPVRRAIARARRARGTPRNAAARRLRVGSATARVPRRSAGWRPR